MQKGLSKQQILKLSVVFALIYFFSTNGLASLPGITISFLLKDTLLMTATQAAYFGAIITLGWVIKPIWGIISDPATFKHPFTGETFPVRASWQVQTAGPHEKLKIPQEAR